MSYSRLVVNNREGSMSDCSANFLMDFAKKFPVLTREQEQDIARRAKSGDAKARELLINSNIKFAMRRANAYRVYINGKVGIRFDDIAQAAMLGLTQAADNFDPDKGCKFVTYAVFWINACINDYVRYNFSEVRYANSKACKRLFFKQKKVKAIANLPEKDQEGARKKLANDVGVSLAELSEMEERFHGKDIRCFTSRFNGIMPSMEKEMRDKVAEHSSAVASIQSQQLAELLHEVLKSRHLDDRERKIIKGRFFEDKRLEAIGEEIGRTRERVRQIENKALAKMREVFENNGVDASAVV